MKIFRKQDEIERKEDKAVILFDTVKNGLLAEKVILNERLYAKKVAPPPEYRKGCEISVEIRCVDQKDIERVLSQKGITHQGIITV